MLPTSWGNPFRRIRLNLAIIVPFALLTVLAVGLAGYLSFRNGQAAAVDVAEQLRDEITLRISEHVQSLLEKPHQINEMNAGAIRQGLLDSNDQSALERYFWEQMGIFKTVTSIYFGNTRGGLVDSGREGAAESRYVIVTDRFQSGPFKKYAVDGLGNRTELLLSLPDFDARTRPWYSGAVQSGNAVWSPIYILYTGQDMAIAASRPVYDERNELLGVVSVDIFLSQLAEFLRTLTIGKTGQAFIMERSGLLVASSTGEKVFTEAQGDKTPGRVYAYQSVTPVVQNAAEVLKQRFGDYDGITGAENLQFTIDGDRQFLQVSPFKDGHGIDWLIVVVIPEADFMAHVNATNRATAYLLIGVLVLIIASGIIAAREITRPILRLSTSARAMAEGKWTDTDPEDSRIDEIADLGTSFKRMAGQLRQTLESLSFELSEHKQMEEVLRESEERLQVVLKGAELGSWDWDVQTGHVVYNERWAEMLGYTLDEIEPHVNTWEQLVHPEDQPHVLEVLNAHLAGKTSLYQTEHRLRARDGRWIWVLDKGKVIRRDREGKPLRAAGTHLDITERKQIERQLRESEEKFRSIFDNSLDGIFLISPDGPILSANPAACRMLGWSEKEICEGGRELVVDSTDPRLPQVIAERTRTGRFLGEVNYRRKDGTCFPVELSSTVFSLGNDNLRACVIFRDITERKRAEDLLRQEHSFRNAIITNIVDGLCVCHEIKEYPFVRFSIWNDRMTEITGYTMEEINRLGWYQTVYPDLELQARAIERMKRMRQEDDLRTEEWEITRADGNNRVLSISTSVLESADGLLHVMALMQDITDRKRAEEERLHFERRLQQSEKAEGLARMAGAIAHRFNNMLGTVLGNLELLLDDLQQGSELRTYVAEAMQAATRAAETSRFMLTYLGQTTARREQLDLSQVVEESQALLGTSIPTNVSLRTRLPSEGPITRADRAHLLQILTNLVSNAVEAIGETEGDLTVAVEVVSAETIAGARFFPLDWKPRDKGYACLAVADTGPGLDAKTIDNIFDPFFTTKFTGRGLGLSIVLGLMRVCEGVVTVDSTPGKGAVFRVCFPLAEQAEPAPREDLPAPAQSLSGGLVLVVDDEAALRKLVQHMLERHMGCKVISADNGFEAVDMFRQHKSEISLVLLDLTMPGMDGWQTLTALRALRPDIPVILASGFDEAQVMQGVHQEKPQGFLHKPYSLNDLRAAFDLALT